MKRHEQLAEDIARALGDLLDRANYKPNSTDLKYIGQLLEILRSVDARLAVSGATAEHDKLVGNDKFPDFNPK